MWVYLWSTDIVGGWGWGGWTYCYCWMPSVSTINTSCSPCFVAPFTWLVRLDYSFCYCTSSSRYATVSVSTMANWTSWTRRTIYYRCICWCWASAGFDMIPIQKGNCYRLSVWWSSNNPASLSVWYDSFIMNE